MVNFFHRFVPNKAARIMRHICVALAGNPDNLEWSNDPEDAFTTTKAALAQETMVVHTHAECPTALTVAASGAAISAFLGQDLAWFVEASGVLQP